jgi:integrase
MLWHDQTKVGNYNEGIRIPEYLYERLETRRHKTLARFERLLGRPPTPGERPRLALFPSNVRNPSRERAISDGKFSSSFRAWVLSLDLGGNVPHQARHTLATKLLAAGATADLPELLRQDQSRSVFTLRRRPGTRGPRRRRWTPVPQLPGQRPDQP